MKACHHKSAGEFFLGPRFITVAENMPRERGRDPWKFTHTANIPISHSLGRKSTPPPLSFSQLVVYQHRLTLVSIFPSLIVSFFRIFLVRLQEEPVVFAFFPGRSAVGKNTGGAAALVELTAHHWLGRDEHPLSRGNCLVLPGFSEELPHGGNHPCTTTTG